MSISRDQIRKSGELSGTDKISHHGYERFYSDFLNRVEIKNEIIEIGYGEGLSINFWKNIFPDSYLNLIDKDINEIGEGYQVFKCDQSSYKELTILENHLKSKSIDLIIDDGSHIPEHIILTFNIFFKSLLNPGCSYIIEDIETSYWRNTSCYGYPTNYGVWSRRSIINAFATLTHWVNREFLTERQKRKLGKKIKNLGFDLKTIGLIRSITFGHNCICITKNIEEDNKFYERDYRFKYRHKLSVKILETLVPNMLKKRFLSDPNIKKKIKKIIDNLKF